MPVTWFRPWIESRCESVVPVEASMARDEDQGGSKRWWPLDAAVVIVALVATSAVVTLSPWQALRVMFGAVLLFVLPGYVLLVVLIPHRSDLERPTSGGLTGLERAALSFGISVALLPPLYLLAYAIAGTGPSPMIVLSVLNGFVLVGVLLGFLRRLRVEPARRYDPVGRRPTRNEYSSVAGLDRRTTLANVALGASAIGTVGTLAYAIATPPDGESFSEFYLVTENGDGEYTAGDYPTTLTAGQPQSMIVGVENHEGKPVTYEIGAELQRVAVTDRTVEVLERADRTQETIRLGNGQSAHVEPVLTPTITGEELRLQYTLYRDGVDDPPYRELQLWVDVLEEGGSDRLESS